MFTTLRRLPMLSILLFLALPGTGGMVVQALHHCARSAPWTVTAESGAHAGHHHHAGTDLPAEGGEPAEPECQCVGTCAPGTAASPATAAPAPQHTAAVTAKRVGTPMPPAPSPRRPDRLLPPANAPPLS